MIELKKVVLINDMHTYNNYACNGNEKVLKEFLKEKDFKFSFINNVGINKFNINEQNIISSIVIENGVDSVFKMSENPVVLIAPLFEFVEGMSRQSIKSLSNEQIYIYSGSSIRSLFDGLKEFKRNIDLIDLKKREVKDKKNDIKSIKMKIKELKADIKNQEKELIINAIKTELKGLENNISDIKNSNIKREEEIQRLGKRVNLSNFTLDMGINYYLLATLFSYDFIYGANDILILKRKIKGSNKHEGKVKDIFVDFFKKWNSFYENEHSEENLLKVLGKVVKGIDFGFEIKNIYSRYNWSQLSEFVLEEIDMNIDLEISMEDVSALAPVKPNIAASMVASGAGGRYSKEIMVNKNEPALMKSIMIQKASSQKIVINGVEHTEITYVWRTQLGLFNKLRKEIELIED